VEPGTDTDRDARRLRETAALLGAHPPDATIRADALAGSASLDRTLPHVVIEHKGDVATAGNRETFTLGELLGEGGMGKVYAGLQRSLGRGVALKVLEGGSKRDPAHAALLHEARVTGRLEHPNIVPVHVLGVDGAGQPVMVMKRIEGVSWRRLLHEPSHPAWERLLARHRDRPEAHVEILLRVCDALEYAHARGVIHRDLKPDNVMLGAFGEVYLLDWGVALDTRAPRPEKAVVGTPSYMAPEMVEGDPAAVSPATDVYLLGAALHEVLTARPPHRGETLREVLFVAWMAEPPTFGEDVSRELAALCRDAMARVPEKRVATVGAFRAGLLAWVAHRESMALSDAARRDLDLLRARDDVSRAMDDIGEAALACRFAFEQALTRWRENPDARGGLQAVIGLLVERAITLHDVAGARSLLAELPSPDARLADAVATLERDLALTRERASQARAVQREMDFSAWSNERFWVFGALVGANVSLALWVTARRSTGVEASPYHPLIGADAVVALVTSIVLFAVRKRVTANLIGRRMTVIVVLAIASTILVDVFAWQLGWPVPYGSVYRFLALAVVCLFAALLGLPALGYVGAAALGGAALAAAFPAHVYTIVPVGLTLITLMVWGLVRSGRLKVAEVDSLR
jgi:serine/threonine-protein kinase